MVVIQSVSSRAFKPSLWTARLPFAALIFLVLALAACLAQPASAAPLQTLHGHIPAAASRSQNTGRLAATTPLSITIGLPLRNPEGLTNLLADLYDPGSTNYRNFVTPEEFAARFGPTEADYQAVKDFAVASHLEIAHEHANRTLLTVHGSAADIEKAFNVKLLNYAHPTEARSFFAPDAEPSLPASLSVLHIGGLNNFVRPHPMSLKKSPLSKTGFARSFGGSGLDGSFIGYDFRSAYVPGTTLTGTGQSVALVEFDGYYASDITSYEAQAGLPSVTLTNVLVDGYNGAVVDPDANMEVSLDIEMAIAMAPGLSRIIVYEAPNDSNVPNDMLNAMATANNAAQISSSWAFGIDGNTEQIFLQYAAQGISYLNASGDFGATSPANGIYTPSDDPNITSVGGTTLTTSGPNGHWVSETVWNWAPDMEYASTGGISTSYSIPSWQLGISMVTCKGSTSMRNIPDVALTADNIFVEANNGQPLSGIGGTSAATPLWAGFMALVNQQNALAGKPRIGFINPSVYAIGKSAQYTSLFHDITTGNNTNDSSPTLYYAVAGYDLCTGWGTPVGTNLINALAPIVNGPLVSVSSFIVAGESCLPTNGAIDAGETVTVNVSLQNSGTVGTSNLAVTLLSSGGIIAPGGTQNFGALAAGGSSVSRPFTFTAGGVCGSNITGTFQLQDGATNLGTINTVIYLGKPFSGTNFSQNFDASGSLPTGWTTTSTGGASHWSVSSVSYDSYPHCISTPDPGTNGVSDLVSPVIPIGATNAQLSFRNGYDTYQSHCGCVLEIQIGTNAYADIITAGGTFVTGGYNSFINPTNASSILAGRQVWSGVAGSYLPTVVNLPPAAAGQNIHLRWRLASDNYYSYPGWYMDSISMTESYYACCTDTADIGVTQTASTNIVTAGHNLNYTITVTNAGPQSANVMSLTNTLPPGVNFVSASSGGIYANGKVVWNVSSLNANATNQFSLMVTPTVGGAITNTVTAGSVTTDPNLSNQSASTVAMVNASPAISNQPSSQIVILGSNTAFQVSATGMPAPALQWYFNGTNLGGATSSTLSLTNIQLTQQGSYYAIVTNVAGSATSAVATLTVAVKPAISNQPSNQTVLPGKPANFQVAGTGTPLPAYQWYFNGTNIAAATNSSLSLASAQNSQAGSYTVILTNLAGSATSTTAVLNVVSPVPILSVSQTGSNVTVSLSSVSGVTYTLQSKDSLAATNWNVVASPQSGNDSVISLTDTNAGATSRFYRVLCSW